MRQHRLFVPVQLAIALLAILLMAVASPKAALHFQKDADTRPNQGVDPIVTGQTISSDQLEDWKAKRARYLKCGLCGNEQPYPADFD